MNLFGTKNNELAELRRQAEDQKDFAREQSILENSNDGVDEQIYIQQQQDRNDLIRWQQDLTDDMYDLRMRLQSKEKFGDSWKVVKISVKLKSGEIVYRNAPPLVNDQGIQIIMQCVAPLMSRNLMQSDFKEERILTMLKSTMFTLIHNFADNYESYGAQFENLDHIMRLIMNTIMPAPFRAKDGAERKITSTQNKRNETFVNTPQREERRKIFGLL